MDKCCKVAAVYVAWLKAMSHIHQHNHWTTKGAEFYGDHLLFKRLYDSAIEDLDKAAEKFIGVFDEECVDYKLQANLVCKLLLKYNKLKNNPATMSLAVEKEFIKFSKLAYDCFEKEDTLTLGLDDMIMAIASNREESVYLLKQKIARSED